MCSERERERGRKLAVIATIVPICCLFRSITDDRRDTGEVLPIDSTLRAVLGSKGGQSTIA